MASKTSALSAGSETAAPAAVWYEPGAHVPALDGLRGVAIIAVLLYHFGIGLSFTGFEDNMLLRGMMFGWAGVDLFFVLSGFLITGILYDSKSDPHYFRNFYMRRTLRIFPIYFLCIALVFILVQILPPLNTDDNDGWIYPLTFTTNLAVAATADWYTIPVVIGHYWSLAIEEQFYLVWPAVVLFTPRQWLLRIALGLIVGALALRVAMTLTGADPNVIFALTLTRCDALAVGAFCAVMMRDQGDMQRLLRWAPFVLVAGLATIVAIFATTEGANEYSPLMQTLGFSALCISAGALLCLTFALKPLATTLSSSVLRWFGRYSYGMYVWHYPVYYVLYELDHVRRLLGVEADWTGIALFGFAMGVSMSAGVLSYHIVEKRFLDLKRHFERSAAPAV